MKSKNKQKIVVVLAPYADNWSFMVLTALRNHGYEPYFVTLPASLEVNDSDHADVFRYFTDGMQGNWKDLNNTVAFSTDFLILSIRPSLTQEVLNRLAEWFALSKTNAVLYRHIHTGLFRRILFETKMLLSKAPWIKGTNVCISEIEFPRLSLFRLFSRCNAFGALLRNHHLANEDIRTRLFRPFSVDGDRSILASFCGSYLPNNRSEIIDKIEKSSEVAKVTMVSNSLHSDRPQSHFSLIIATDTSRKDERVSFAEYDRISEDSNFSLCFPGYSMTCSRVLEAFYRGSIPVLRHEEKSLYGVPLIDGMNCVFVYQNDWIRALKQLGNYTLPQITRMRRNIEKDIRIHLQWDFVEEKLLGKIGLVM